MNTDETIQVGDSFSGSVKRGVEDGLLMRGSLRVDLFDASGELKDTREIQNLIVNVGKNGITDQLTASPTISKPTHMAIGTGTTAAAAGDTTLQTETASTRVALTSKTRSTNVLTLVGDWAAGVGTVAVTEAAVFDAASAGNMYSRAVFSAINKGASDTLKITWTWTIG